MLMSADKPLKTNTSTPPSAGYRTLMPAGGAAPRPSAPKPASAPSKAAETPSKPDATNAGTAAPEGKEGSHPDPTRFGDWEVKGRCIDF
jgi:hypothetical protein